MPAPMPTTTHRSMTMLFVTVLMLGPVLSLHSVLIMGRETNTAFVSTQILFTVLCAETEIWGWRDIIRILILGVLCRLCAAGLFLLASSLPDGQVAILTDAGLRHLAFLTFSQGGALFLGLYAATAGLSRAKARMNSRWMWLRMLLAPPLGITIAVAVYGVAYTAPDWAGIAALILQRSSIALVLSLALLPVTVAVICLIKRYEESDVLDAVISYNPLSLE